MPSALKVMVDINASVNQDSNEAGQSVWILTNVHDMETELALLLSTRDARTGLEVTNVFVKMVLEELHRDVRELQNPVVQTDLVVEIPNVLISWEVLILVIVTTGMKR